MPGAVPLLRTRTHPAVKRLRHLRDRRDKSLLFVEGHKLAEELLRSPLKPVEFFHTVRFAAGTAGAPLAERLRQTGALETELADDVMAYVSDLDSPPGLIVLASKPAASMGDLERIKSPLFVLLDGLQLPQNAGGILRTAEALGVHAVFSLAGGADLLGPKALRASAGSAFRMSSFSGASAPDLVEFFKRQSISCVAADARGKSPFTSWNWSKPTCLILGSEGSGLKAREIQAMVPSSCTLRIPMKAGVESLNASVAAGIILEEAFRQRNDS